jgi:hypothetical protein
MSITVAAAAGWVAVDQDSSASLGNHFAELLVIVLGRTLLRSPKDLGFDWMMVGFGEPRLRKSQSLMILVVFIIVARRREQDLNRSR